MQLFSKPQISHTLILIILSTSLITALPVFANESDDDLLLLIPSIVADRTRPPSEPPVEPPSDGVQFAINQSVKKFGPQITEQELIEQGVATINVAGLRVYIGTQQVSSINQDPIIVAFGVNGGWRATDLETTGTDGRGVALFSSGNNLFASFTVDGTQGQPSQDFRRVSQNAQPRWLTSYGRGSGAKVSVLAKLKPDTGELISAVYISAVLSSGRSNTLEINNIKLKANGNIEIQANSFFSPRSIDGSALPRTGSDGSPFEYFLELTPDLSRAISSRSPDF